MSDRQSNATVNKSTGDQEFTVGTSDNNILTTEKTVEMKSLERCIRQKFVQKKINIVDTVKDRIQNANLTAIDSIVVPTNNFTITSLNASSGRDATSVTANSERGEHTQITSLSENASS